MEIVLGIIIIAGVGYAAWYVANPKKAEAETKAVNDQITDAVTQSAPAKKTATKKPAAKKASTKKASAKK